MRRPVCTLAQTGTGRRLRGTRRHVMSCLRCQAELARRRRLLRELRTLRDVPELAPAYVAAAVDRRTRTPQVVAAAGGLRGLVPRLAAGGAVAATAAGAAAVVVWRRSHAAI